MINERSLELGFCLPCSALDYANSVLNTGTITARNLALDSALVTNEQRSTNLGTIYQQVSNRISATTGTVAAGRCGS